MKEARGCRLCLAFISAVAMQLSIAGGAAAFCPPVVKDYTQPLRQLPRIAQPPNRLPFAPRLAAVVPVATGKLVSDTKIVAGLKLEGHQDRVLGWVVKTRLDRYVRGKTRVIRESTKGLRELDSSRTRSFLVRAGVSPSLYRWESEFLTKSGRRLRSFGENFRVVRPVFDAHISFEKGTFLPGETLRPCLENLGTESLLYGEAFRVERYMDSQWVLSFGPSSGGSSLIGYWNDPGTAASHWSVTIPLDSPPGLYRVVVGAEASGSSRPQPFLPEPRPVDVVGAFTISEPPV